MIVGAGPAGAACAISLARLGFTVDVIEVRHSPESSASDLALHPLVGGLTVFGHRCSLEC